MKKLALLLSLLITAPVFADDWEDYDGKEVKEENTESKRKEDKDIKLEDCKPVVLNFVTDDDTGVEISGSTVMICNGAYYSLQDTTTVHMMTERNGQVCYSDYTCGNIDAWEGYFSIAGESFYGVLGQFLNGPMQEIARNYGYLGSAGVDVPTVKVGAVLSFGKGHMERSCKEISDKICFTK